MDFHIIHVVRHKLSVKKLNEKSKRVIFPFFQTGQNFSVKIHDAIVLVSQPKINMYNHELQQGCGLIT